MNTGSFTPSVCNWLSRLTVMTYDVYTMPTRNLESSESRHLVSFVNFKESISYLFISNGTTALALQSTWRKELSHISS